MTSLRTELTYYSIGLAWNIILWYVLPLDMYVFLVALMVVEMRFKLFYGDTRDQEDGQ